LPHLFPAIKGFFRSSDFKPEADRAAGAVESAEEDLKELKKINQQVRASFLLTLALFAMRLPIHTLHSKSKGSGFPKHVISSFSFSC
jgi:hypothetical protein